MFIDRSNIVKMAALLNLFLDSTESISKSQQLILYISTNLSKLIWKSKISKYPTEYWRITRSEYVLKDILKSYNNQDSVLYLYICMYALFKYIYFNITSR